MEITPLLPEFLEKFYFSSLNSYIAFGFFLAGIFFLIRKKNLLLNTGLLVITVIFLVFTWVKRIETLPDIKIKSEFAVFPARH